MTWSISPRDPKNLKVHMVQWWADPDLKPAKYDPASRDGPGGLNDAWRLVCSRPKHYNTQATDDTAKVTCEHCKKRIPDLVRNRLNG